MWPRTAEQSVGVLVPLMVAGVFEVVKTTAKECIAERTVVQSVAVSLHVLHGTTLVAGLPDIHSTSAVLLNPLKVVRRFLMPTCCKINTWSEYFVHSLAAAQFEFIFFTSEGAFLPSQFLERSWCSCPKVMDHC